MFLPLTPISEIFGTLSEALFLKEILRGEDPVTGEDPFPGEDPFIREDPFMSILGHERQGLAGTSSSSGAGSYAAFVLAGVQCQESVPQSEVCSLHTTLR